MSNKNKLFIAGLLGIILIILALSITLIEVIKKNNETLKKVEQLEKQTKVTLPPAQEQPKAATTNAPVFEIKNGVLLYMKPCDAEDIVVPEGVKNVCIDGIVNSGKRMKNLTIPEGVEIISRRSGAYRPGTVFNSVKIPASVKSIKANAFDGEWRQLRKIDIAPGSPYTMQDGCLIDTRNKSLVFALPGRGRIVVPNSVKSIGDWSFKSNDAMEIIVPEGIVQIGRGAFHECRELVTLSLPASVEMIGEQAFSNCGKLSRIAVSTENPRYAVHEGLLLNRKTKTLIRAFGPLFQITIPEDVETIGDNAFSFMDSLTSVTVPPSVKRIEKGAFAYCSNLEELQLPDKLDFYDSHFIMGCTKLREINLPPGLKTIAGNFSFGRCSSLRELVFPEGVQSIDNNGVGAVNKCENLERIFIPASVSTIKGGAFISNPSLKSIDVHQDNLAFLSKDGVLFSKDMMRLVRCPETKKGIYEIPQIVQKIDPYAFSNCCDLKKIQIPESVTEIGQNAFAECTSLEMIEFENRSFKLNDNVFGRAQMGGKVHRPLTNLTNK